MNDNSAENENYCGSEIRGTSVRHRDHVEGTWPETPLPELVLGGNRKTRRFSASDLKLVNDAIRVASGVGIGTFHLPRLGNLKVKYDKSAREHYIKL